MDAYNSSDHGLTLAELNKVEVSRLFPLLIYLSAIGLFGIPGNTLVIYAFRRSWRTSNSKLFFIWLAVIDLLNCSLSLPLEFLNVVNQYTYTNEWLCKTTLFSTYWLTVTSGITLVIITIDRFRKVCRPFKWQFLNRTARILCMVSSVFGLGVSWPVLVLFGIHRFKTVHEQLEGSECSVANDYQRSGYVRMYNVFLWILFAVTFLMIMLLYVVIGRRIFTRAKVRRLTLQQTKLNETSRKLVLNTWHKKDNNNEQMENVWSVTAYNAYAKPCPIYRQNIKQKIAEGQAKARKSATIMFLISLAFIISFLPYLILRMRQAVSSHFISSMTNTERAIYKTFLRSYWLNCAINPFIYCACAPEFRNECKQMWKKLVSCILGDSR